MPLQVQKQSLWRLKIISVLQRRYIALHLIRYSDQGFGFFNCPFYSRSGMEWVYMFCYSVHLECWFHANSMLMELPFLML